jgi:NADPH2:quinone reductase
MTQRSIRAVGYSENKSIDDVGALLDLTLDLKPPQGRDVLVRVHATAVNPVDTKLRRFAPPSESHRVLGFDAAGVIAEVGSDVRLFAPGDEVFYAGTVHRTGSNAEYQLVDERLVAKIPASLSLTTAAALPLTAITAWECLFERLGLDRSASGVLLVVGAAGGVGTMAIQLARRTGLTVIATASRPASCDWVQRLGAHHVVHPARLVDEVLQYAPDGVDFIITPFSSGRINDYAKIIRPHGAIVGLDDPDPPSLASLKPKSVTWHWESIFTRPLHDLSPERHHDILNEIGRLIESGELRPPPTHVLSPLNAQTLRKAHQIVEQHSAHGKVVIAVNG